MQSCHKGAFTLCVFVGVDQELYELTQAKLDTNGGSSRVIDAFARLMSTVEKTSTSTRSVILAPSQYYCHATRGSHNTDFFL